jgi:Zn-dependent oligopeptidase
MFPFTTSESVTPFLPQFMEQWVWEPTFLKSLIVASGDPVDDDTIQALYEQASIAKADDLARQAYYSATEWAMFSNFNIQSGGETVMALAQRMARQYIPHDVPHSADLGALYNIADANIRDNEHVALYRYLWAEAIATNIFEQVKASYETKKVVPTSAIYEHLVNPSCLDSLSTAFELSNFMNTHDPPLDALWRRYRLT